MADSPISAGFVQARSMCVEVSPGMASSFAVAASPVGAPGTRVVVMALAPTDASPVPIALIAYTR